MLGYIGMGILIIAIIAVVIKKSKSAHKGK